MIGYLAATTVLAVEDEKVVDGFGVMGTLLAGMGCQTHSAARYEAAVKADGLLVMAHGSTEHVAMPRRSSTGQTPWSWTPMRFLRPVTAYPRGSDQSRMHASTLTTTSDGNSQKSLLGSE